MSLLQDVDLYVASSGNYVMTEIAEMFATGFRANGIASRVLSDRVPPRHVAHGSAAIIVAPHEYVPLFLAHSGTNDWRSRLRGTYVLNVEQPGSQWFETAYEYARLARGVFDISRVGADELKKRGVMTTHAPLRYSPLMGCRADWIAERPIDLTFMGTNSERRERFLSQQAEFLSRFVSRIILARVERPRVQGTPGFLAGAPYRSLLAESRVLLNVHSMESNYFEWHRVLMAIANGCVVISEQASETEPFISGTHVMLGSIHDLPTMAESLLNDEPRRAEIAEQAYEAMTHETMTDTCHSLISILERPSSSADSLSVAIRDAADHIRSWICPVSDVIPPRRPITTEANDGAVDVRNPPSLTQWNGQESTGFTIESNDRLAPLPIPSVSVIVTLFNYRSYVVECLQSVCRSSIAGMPGGFEIVVIDDASTDGSAEVVSAFLHSAVVPIRLVRGGTNRGLPASRNLGVALSKAPYVFILDADNRIFPRCLSALHAFASTEDLDAAYAIIQRFANDQDGLGLVSCYVWEPRELLRVPYIDAMALFRRTYLLAIGGYSEDFSTGWEDYDVWLRMAGQNARCSLLPEILASYRVHDHSMLRTTTNAAVNRIAGLLKERHAHLIASHQPLDRLFGFPQS